MAAVRVAFVRLEGALAGCNLATDAPVATNIVTMPVQADAPSVAASPAATVGSVLVDKEWGPNGRYVLRASGVVEEVER